jgi:Caspase domain
MPVRHGSGQREDGRTMLKGLLVNLLGRITVATVLLVLVITPLQAEPLVFHASMPGKQSLDQGEGGGNPFASALIEALSSPSMLSDLPAVLRQLTNKKSRGFQSADVPLVLQRFSLVPAEPGQRRLALVMVVSDYASSGGAQSLPGAKHDAERVALALRRAGFQTEQALNFGLEAMREKLGEFGDRSRDAEAAVIYTTGHGVEVEGTIFLLPGDYPIAERNSALDRRALPLPEIIRSLKARHINLIFYGGCRDNPLAQ